MRFSFSLYVLCICCIVCSTDAVLSVYRQPALAQAGQPLQIQPQIQVYANPDQQILIQVSSLPDSTAIYGTKQIYALNGWANFTDLLLLRFGVYSLNFISNYGEQISTATFSVASGLDHFVLKSVPLSSVVAGESISPPVSIQCADRDNLPLPNSNFPVLASIETVGTDPTAVSFPAVLRAEFSAQSCCMFPDCEQTSSVFASCCDCTNQSCALCAMPKDGNIIFPGLRINKVGQYQLVFTTNATALVDLITNPSTVFRPSGGVVSVVPGTVFGIKFLVQPAGPLYLDGPSGLGVFQLSPSIKICDSQGNFLSQTPKQGESAQLRVCYSFDDVIMTVPLPAGLCECSDRACLSVDNSSILRGPRSKLFLSDSSAAFSNLTISAAFNALRLFAAKSYNGSWIASCISQPFSVLPGSLYSIGPVLEPASTRGCPRCPEGLIVANTDFNLTVQLLDRYRNRIAICPGEISPYCRGVPTADVLVRIFSGLQDLSAAQSQLNLLGTTRQTSSFGVARFQNLRVLISNGNYVFKFFGFVGLNQSGVSSSGLFQVVPGAPAQLASVSTFPTLLTDSEPFVLAADVIDGQGNVVNSDCYTDCGGLLSSSCSANITLCSVLARAGLVNVGPSSRLTGTLQTSSLQGRVTFSNLTLEANWVGGDACNCPTPQTCLACSAQLCSMPLPWPIFQLSVYLPSLAGASITLTVSMKRRIQSLVLLNQPKAMPAQEPISNPIQVQALQCDGTVAIFSTARVLVQIDSRGQNSFSQIAGNLVVPLSQGLALFTDLQFDQTGTYGLRFILQSGNTNSILVTSQTFTVSKAVSKLLVVSTPGPATAGLPFAIQPIIKLLDDSGDTVDQSALAVTATIQDNPGNLQVHDPGMSVLLGNVAVGAQHGLVAFTDLRIIKASLGQDLSRTGYTLRFSAGSVGVTSSQFTVAPAKWAGLFIPPFAQPIGSDAGSLLARQPMVYLVDAFVNRILVSSIPTDTRVQVVLVAGTTNIILQRNGCNETCSPVKSAALFPLRCTTCNDLFLMANSSIVTFTDLRLDIATGLLPGQSESYRLNFTSSRYFRVSSAFFVQSSVPAYLALDQDVPQINSADFLLSMQPIVSIRDRFGNVVVSISHIKAYAELLLPIGANLTAGQGGLCLLAPKFLEGNTSVDFYNGSATFTNLAVRQAVQGYILQFAANVSSGTVKATTAPFSVVAGSAVDLCVMSDLGGCSDLSPCISPAVIVCVDDYGNVQPSCAACPSSSCCGRSPFNVPMSLRGPCFGAVCADIAGGPAGRSMSFWSAAGNTDCVNSSCSVPLLSGGASFSSIALSPPGSDYQIQFSTYIECMGSLIQWSVTQRLNVSAAAPVVLAAMFSNSLASVEIFFDKETNMRLSQPSTCDIFDASFEAKLGVDPVCTWIDPTTVLILLGDASSVDNSSQVLLSATCGIRSRVAQADDDQATTRTGAIVAGNILSPIYISLPPELPSPVPVIVIPHDLGTCSLLHGDSSLSQGYAARAFSKYEWGLDASQSSSDVGILEASAQAYPNLKLSAAYFIKAVIHFSSFAPRSINTVTVTLRPSMPVTASALLIISGLPGYSTPQLSCPLRPAENASSGTCFLGSGNCKTALLRGSSAYLFAATNLSWPSNSGVDANQPRAQWMPDGQLVLKVDPSHSIPTTEDTIFSFQLMNPSGLSARVVSISFSYSGPLICPVSDCVMSESIALTTNTWFRPQAMETDCNSTDLDSVIPDSFIQSIPCISKRSSFYVTADAVDIQSGYILESSNVINQENTLSLNFQLSSQPPPGLVVTVSGLMGLSYPGNSLCLDGPDAGLFECNACVRGLSSESSFGPAGTWNPFSGQLVLNFAYKKISVDNATAARNISVSFTLVNAATSNRRPCGMSDALACPSQASPVLMVGAALRSYPLQGDVLGSGYSPAFLTATAQESNSFQNLTNLVSVAFTVNFLLTAQCSVSVSGLPSNVGNLFSYVVGQNGLPCIQQSYAPGAQPDISYFTMTIVNNCKIQPGSQVIIWVTVQNPARPTAGGTLSVSAACPGINVGKQTVSVGPLFRAQNSVIFYAGVISSDNSVPYQSAAIEIAFIASAAMFEGSSLRVSGLSGSNTGNNALLPVTITVAGSGKSSVQTAALDSQAGVLQMLLATSVPAQTPVALRFRVLNGMTSLSLANSKLSGQIYTGLCISTLECPPFANSSRNTVFVSAIPLNLTTKVSNVLPGIIIAEIAESTRVKNARNFITVRIRCNFDFSSTTSITIAGLDGSQTPKVSRLIPVANWLELFPNCSCPYSEDSYPCLLCTETDSILISQSIRVWQPDVDSAGTTRFGKVTYTPTGQPYGSVLGSWSPLCEVKLPGASCLTLSLSPDQQHPANTDFTFGFILQNSAKAVPAVSPTIFIKSGSISVNAVLVGSVLGSGVEPGFSYLSIQQDSVILGTFTTITIQLQTNCPVASDGYSGGSITIGGLSKFETPSGYLPLQGADARVASRDGWGLWQQDGAALVLNGAVLTGDCSTSLEPGNVPLCTMSGPQSTVTFSVILKNKRLAVIGQALPTASASATALQLASTPFGGLALNRATMSAGFTIATVRQSSRVQGQANNVSFTFSCNNNLTSFGARDRSSASSITISGLVGTQTPDQVGMPLTGSNSSLFDAASTSWSQGTGTLTLYLADSMNVAPNDVIQVSVMLINPSTPQQASISISATVFPVPDTSSPPILTPIVIQYGLPLVLATTAMQGLDILSARVPAAVTSGGISESSLVAAAINTITLNFTLNVDLQAGGVIQLSGLRATTSPTAQIVVGGQDGTSVSSAVWDKTAGTMVLILSQPLYADAPFAISFKLQNRQCPKAVPPARQVSMTIAGPTTPGTPQVSLGPVLLTGQLVGCGAQLVWRRRRVAEFSEVVFALNTITFSIQPSAPLYSGSIITISGLTGTQTLTCVSCLTKSKIITWTLGMSCSLLCEEDACASVGGSVGGLPNAACIPVFSGSPPNPSEVFGQLGLWKGKDGTLLVTVADGRVLDDTRPTDFSITVWNPVAPQSRVDCTPDDGGSTGAGCLTVTTSAPKMCDTSSTRLDSEACRSGVSVQVAGIAGGTPPLSALYDRCPICLRSSDVMAAHDALQAVSVATFTDLAAQAPALEYLPTLVPGGLIQGTYVLLLTLTNWLGMTSTASSTFTADGPLPLSGAKPSVYIEGAPEVSVHSYDAVQLSAKGAAAGCIEGFETESVSYTWSLDCAGSVEDLSPSDPICALVPALGAIVATAFSSILSIPPRSLPAGAVLSFACSVRQVNLQSAAQSYVRVRVLPSPVVAIITGGAPQISPSADFYFSATASYDPDASATGLTSHIVTVNGRSRTTFEYQWGCERLACQAGSSSCPTEGVPCPPRLLGISRDTAVPVVAPFRTDDYEVGVNHSLLVRGAAYRVTLNISRRAEMLPAPLRPLDLFLTVSTAQFDFSVSEGTPVNVTIELCGATCDGPGAVSNLVGTASRIALSAAAAPTSSRPAVSVASVAWSVVRPPSDGGLLDGPAVMTSTTSLLLVLRAGALVPGHTVVFRCTAVDTDGNAGYAEVAVEAALPPLGGGLAAYPSSGVALNTTFQLRAAGWTVDVDRLPLIYAFLLTVPDAYRTNLTLARSSSLVVNTLLPAGSGTESTVALSVAVADALGSVSLRRRAVPVSPRPVSYAQLGALVQAQTDAAFRGGDMVAVQALLGFAALSLQQAGAGAASLSARQVFRIRLLLLLAGSQQSQVPSVAGVLSRVAALSVITQAPDELNFEGVEAAVAAVTDAGFEMAAIAGDPPDGFAVAAGFARVYDNLMRAMATVARPTGYPLRSLPDQRRRLQSAEEPPVPQDGLLPGGGAGGAGQGTLPSKPAVPAAAAGGGVDVRVAGPVAADFRAAMGQLLAGISRVSSLSVRDALVGELPRAVSSDLWDMATARVATAGFEGFTARVGNATAAIPADMFLQIDKALMPTRPATAEIMMVQFRTSPLPLHDDPLGPPVILEVRAFGSFDPLPLLAAVSTPISLRLPWAGQLSGGVDWLGRTKVPYIGRFETAAAVWDWTSDGVALVSTGAAAVTVSVGRFGVYSAFGAHAGCDEVPASAAVWDSCGVCKGDNSTCSGCDGVPNTGRSKNCSGNGRCVAGAAQCQCSPNWYGEECNTSCSLATVCGGHGFCDPASGLRCFCLAGWASASPLPQYPGPFCTVSVAVAVNTTAAEAAKARTLSVILDVVLPALGGTLGVTIVAVYLFTAGRRRRRALRAKILDLGLPPPRPAPDETGWGTDMPGPGGGVGEEGGGGAAAAVPSEVDIRAGGGAAAAAMAASVRAAVERRGADGLRQRADAMRMRIAAAVTPARYGRGPISLPAVVPEAALWDEAAAGADGGERGRGGDDEEIAV